MPNIDNDLAASRAKLQGYELRDHFETATESQLNAAYRFK
jgi:hypothetical protein